MEKSIQYNAMQKQQDKVIIKTCSVYLYTEPSVNSYFRKESKTDQACSPDMLM